MRISEKAFVDSRRRHQHHGIINFSTERMLFSSQNQNSNVVLVPVIFSYQKNHFPNHNNNNNNGIRK